VPLLIFLNVIEDVVWIFLNVAEDGAQESLVGGECT
jgi:hypothetical protein